MKRKLLLLPVFAAVIAIAGLLGSPRGSEANQFNPFFGPSAFYQLSTTATNGNPDITAQFNVLPPSANFSAQMGRAVTFGDAAGFNASAAQIPGVGAYMGQLSSVAQLGLANEGCQSPVAVTFNFVEANVDTTAQSIDTAPGDGNPNTSNDPLTLNGAITAGATSLVYAGASNTDPMGIRTDLLPVNIIQIDSEKMLITNAPAGLTNTHGGVSGGTNAAKTYTVTRGWEGTAAAAHANGAEIKRVNIIFPAGPDSNLLANMAEDDGNMDNIGGVENVDYGGNLVSDGADSGAPSFIRDSFDADGNQANGGYVQPHARYYGVAFVANSLIVTLQFVIGAPGALSTFPNLSWAGPDWGYSSSTFLQDPLAPPSNSAISDFCNFTSNTLLYGLPHDNACTGAVSPPAACSATGAGFTLRLAVDNGCPAGSVIPPTNPNECGLAGQANGICAVTTCPRATNPATAQSVRYYQYSVSQRDYDEDNIDNALDVCPNVANAGWDPRALNSLSGSDTDGDGLPNACDPAPAAFNNDQDGDGWQNRIDTCPTVANAAPGGGGGTAPNTFQYDMDSAAGANTGDGGSSNDNIGPACDAGGGGTGNLTSTGANGHYHATAAAQTICIGAATADCSTTADADGDGVVNARDTCINGANPPQISAGPDGQDTTSAAAGAGATTISVGSTAGFEENQPIVIGLPGDGKGGRETIRYINAGGVAATTLTFSPGLSVAHSATSNVAQVAFAQPIMDNDNDGSISVTGDITKLAGAAFSQGGDPANDGVGDAAPPGFQARYDVNNDRFIDVTGDIGVLGGIAFLSCGPPGAP